MEGDSDRRHFWRNAAVLIVVATIISTQIVAWNYFQGLYGVSSHSTANSGPGRGSTSGDAGKANSTQSNPNYLEVRTLINYGNGTSKWYNESNVPIGWNFYNLTSFLFPVRSEWYPSPLNEHQVLAINGVEQRLPYYWALWSFCLGDHAWMYSKVGADDLHLTNGAIFAWYFSASDTAPVPGAKTIFSCSP